MSFNRPLVYSDPTTRGASCARVLQVDQAHGNELGALAMRQKILFKVVHADPDFANKVKSEVKTAIHGSRETEQPVPGDGGAPARIPSSGVDEAIRSHHRERRSPYSIYFVHTGEGSHEYAHEPSGIYESPRGDALGEASGVDGLHEAGTAFSYPADCGYAGWVGERERYAWLDVDAYVSSGWGPREPAQGIVSPFTLPDVARIGEDPAWLSTKLAGLAYRTAAQLMVPTLLFSPGGLRQDSRSLESSDVERGEARHKAMPKVETVEKKVEVRLYHLCDTRPCPAAVTEEWGSLQGLLQEPAETPDTGGADGSNGFLPEVRVAIEEIEVLREPLLATGLHQALRREGKRSTGRSANVLVSDELRRWFRRFLDAMGRDSRDGLQGGGELAGFHRVVPLFVISLDTGEPVLLDRHVRSAAFPDMVISVDSRGGRLDTAFQCGGRHVSLATGPAGGREDKGPGPPRRGGPLRETVASLAQLIWGVGPRAFSWSSSTNTFTTDYLWATGASMHTPLSPHTSLTFNERDAYARTHTLRRVDAIISNLRRVLSLAAEMEPALDLAPNVEGYSSEWQGTKEELDHCLHALSDNNYDSVLRYLQRLESKSQNLIRIVSKEYGEGAHRADCLCRGADGRSGDQSLDAWILGVGNVLFVLAAVLLCAALYYRMNGGRRPSVRKEKVG